MALGGPRKVAEQLPDVTLRRVQRWRDRDSIPWMWRQAVRQVVLRANRKRRAAGEPEIELPDRFLIPFEIVED